MWWNTQRPAITRSWYCTSLVRPTAMGQGCWRGTVALSRFQKSRTYQFVAWLRRTWENKYLNIFFSPPSPISIGQIHLEARGQRTLVWALRSVRHQPHRLQSRMEREEWRVDLESQGENTLHWLVKQIITIICNCKKTNSPVFKMGLGSWMRAWHIEILIQKE